MKKKIPPSKIRNSKKKNSQLIGKKGLKHWREEIYWAIKRRDLSQMINKKDAFIYYVITQKVTSLM